MDSTQIVTIVTIIITWLLGIFSKKSKYINTNLIPLQNIAIGIIVATIEYIITKDFDASIMISGVVAGGLYDVQNNLRKLKKEN